MKNKTILAVGADIKNKFLIARGKRLYFGPDIGDLNNAENYEIFKKEIQKAIKNTHPDIIAYDLHPGYFSTKLAKEYNTKSKLKPVQHHYAHIGSVLYEHRIEDPVIGVSFDGTGLGLDGNIWGGEFLVVRRKEFKRKAHLEYIKMPGGDKAVMEPWRMVLSILGRRGATFLKSVKQSEKEIILSMCQKNINSPLTSSAGRLFDAAAALLGICEYARYEAEGPIKLESMCRDGVDGSYKFDVNKIGDQYIIGTKKLFLGMCDDLKNKIPKAVIATKFHNSMAKIIIETVKKISSDTVTRNIALSGGVFQNKFLKHITITKLEKLSFRVFTNKKYASDFNISLGQYHVSCRTS